MKSKTLSTEFDIQLKISLRLTRSIKNKNNKIDKAKRLTFC